MELPSADALSRDRLVETDVVAGENDTRATQAGGISTRETRVVGSAREFVRPGNGADSRPDQAQPPVGPELRAPVPRAVVERQRWADRLDKIENPVSNRTELRDRLNNFEPGHPSSPWDEHGKPRPPAPRLADLERLDPPLSDAAYAAHVTDARKKLDDARASGLKTEKLFALDPDFEEWTLDRAQAHKAILDEKWNSATEIPCERRAIIAGGLGGAGKTTVLDEHRQSDQTQYLTIDPDEFKKVLADRGLVPVVKGLSPMEASTLAHEESSYLARQLAVRAVREGKNVIWDVTMSSSASASRRVDELRSAGYERIAGIFVDIPIETSIQRTEARHRRGCDLYLSGQGSGGRYVPPEVIQAQSDPEFGSKNRRAFETLKDRFDHWTIYDNSVDGRPPILIDSHKFPSSGLGRDERST
jgi:predicted ABC-type ATPase